MNNSMISKQNKNMSMKKKNKTKYKSKIYLIRIKKIYYRTTKSIII